MKKKKEQRKFDITLVPLYILDVALLIIHFVFELAKCIVALPFILLHVFFLRIHIGKHFKKMFKEHSDNIQEILTDSKYKVKGRFE